jgi:hypothetical protein
LSFSEDDCTGKRGKPAASVREISEDRCTSPEDECSK